MSQDQYIDMCEQMGWEIDEGQMPKEPSTLAYEVQQALLVLNVLPDKWEGMSGFHMGKDVSALGTYLDLYDIKDKKQTLYFFKHIENEHSQLINEKIKKKQDAQKNRVGKGT